MNNEIKNILITGGRGFIGTHLTDLLERKGYVVRFLSREAAETPHKAYAWDPGKKLIDKEALTFADAIINLAGTSISEKRWSAQRKRMIMNSRYFSTNLLYETLSGMDHHVKLIINASAIGIYGNSRDMIFNEESPVANNFLARVCRKWEETADKFKSLNIRTVIFRIGLVLSMEEGLLPEMIKPLRLGIATVFGSGKQYQSWIHIDDLCKILWKTIEDEKMHGVYNAVAPGPVSNRNFTLLMAQIWGHGFIVIRIPALILKLMVGEIASLVTDGSRISSKKLQATGFVFKFPQADLALRNLFDK